MIKRIFVIYQRNHKSMNLKYEVFGKSLLTDESRETKTSNTVTVPINLSEKFSISIKRVEYANKNNNVVGRKVFNI